MSLPEPGLFRQMQSRKFTFGNPRPQDSAQVVLERTEFHASTIVLDISYSYTTLDTINLQQLFH